MFANLLGIKPKIKRRKKLGCNSDIRKITQTLNGTKILSECFKLRILTYSITDLGAVVKIRSIGEVCRMPLCYCRKPKCREYWPPTEDGGGAASAERKADRPV